MTSSHSGMVSDPSANAEDACGRCHGEEVINSATSLHSSFRGYKTFFEARSGLSLESDHHLETEFKNECGTCHTTCGQCHISFPNSVKGGLIQGHRFLPTPSQSDNCMSCHGSRIGEEYSGSRSGYAADAHYVPGGMNCISCHSGREMHGNGTEYESRYHSSDMPRCEDCHVIVEGENEWHDHHTDKLQCQICHSQDYKNCNSCHVGGEGISEPSYIKYKIGKNPLPELRDYEYVLLRHIPIAEDTFDPWGIADLADYEALPTWKYTSPHNIQIHTARTDTTGGVSCFNACHSTPDEDGWFLRQSDLDSMSTREATANADLIVPNGNPMGW
ncbi:MAG: hypothetical protein P9L92_19895 [Candidatus Electryonea clarkiae]|nr:hypothetical protein [Candidatus Electryonea clarkiae]MDP8287649.1 hypothetical protein [Candidatus Electryonea clarkiae]